MPTSRHWLHQSSTSFQNNLYDRAVNKPTNTDYNRDIEARNGHLDDPSTALVRTPSTDVVLMALMSDCTEDFQRFQIFLRKIISFHKL